MEQLIAHVKACNVKTQAWIDEDPTNRWAGMYSEDREHWINRGITTVEQLERYELETFVYEATKDLYSYRPSGLSEMTMEELEQEAERLSKASEIEMENDRRREEKAYQDFVKRIEDIQNLVAGASKEDALRILIESEDETQSVEWYGYESLEYSLRLKYGTIDKWLQVG